MLRFYYLQHGLKLGISFKDSLIANSIAPIVGRLTPAKLGEGVKLFILKHDKKKVGFIFVMEKLADIFTLLVVSVFAIYTLGSYYNAYITLAVIFIGVIIVLFNIEKFLNFVLKKNILEDSWFRNSLAEISPLQWMVFACFSTVMRFLIMSVPFIISAALGFDISLWIIIQTYAIAVLIGNVSGLPGGIGTREISFSFLLVTYASLPKEAAGIIALMVIFTDLVIESLLALVGWLFLKKV